MKHSPAERQRGWRTSEAAPVCLASRWLWHDPLCSSIWWRPTQRKCSFLAEVVAQAGLDNVAVRCTRAEDLPGEVARESYGVVLARAVAPLATLVEYAGPLLEQGGELIAWKGSRDPDEERVGESAGRQVGLELVTVQPVTPYPQSRNRHLYLYRKVRPCPPRFPRRPGMARRNPLREA